MAMAMLGLIAMFVATAFHTNIRTANDICPSSNTKKESKPESITITPPSNFLELLINSIEKCRGLKKLTNDISETINSTVSVVSYLAVARAGSTTLCVKIAATERKRRRNYHNDTGMVIYNHHDHVCTLQDFERVIKESSNGAASASNVDLRIFISLRHPLARISSGVSRRMENKLKSAKKNALFFTYFVNDGTNKKENNTNVDDVHVAEKYVRALRDESDPLHYLALHVTFDPKGQEFFKPISEFYLANSTYSRGITDETRTERKTEVEFLCIDTLDDGYDSAWQRWVPTQNLSVKKKQAKSTKSNISSGSYNNVLSRFSKESVDWVERIYARDVALFKEHCPERYHEYTAAKMDLFHTN